MFCVFSKHYILLEAGKGLAGQVVNKHNKMTRIII